MAPLPQIHIRSERLWMVNEFLSDHPTRWVTVRKVVCAINHFYNRHYKDEEIRYELERYTPLLFEKDSTGYRKRYRLQNVI